MQTSSEVAIISASQPEVSPNLRFTYPQFLILRFVLLLLVAGILIIDPLTHQIQAAPVRKPLPQHVARYFEQTNGEILPPSIFGVNMSSLLNNLINNEPLPSVQEFVLNFPEEIQKLLQDGQEPTFEQILSILNMISEEYGNPPELDLNVTINLTSYENEIPYFGKIILERKQTAEGRFQVIFTKKFPDIVILDNPNLQETQPLIQNFASLSDAITYLNQTFSNLPLEAHLGNHTEYLGKRYEHPVIQAEATGISMSYFGSVINLNFGVNDETVDGSTDAPSVYITLISNEEFFSIFFNTTDTNIRGDGTYTNFRTGIDTRFILENQPN